MQKIKKGYKQTEIGVIPDDWEVKLVDEVVRISTGSKNTQDKVDNGKYPFYVRSQTVEKINSFSYDCEAVLTAGDGVGTGKVFHYVNHKFELHQRVYIMNDFVKDLYGYYFYLFFSNNFYDRIMQMTAKSSVDSVRREMIADMKIPIPPLPEQKAIAQVLSDTDQLIQTLQQKIAKKRAIKQGAMQKLLKPKDDWEFISFDEAFSFLSTASYSRAQSYESGEISYVHYGDIHTKLEYFLDFKKDELNFINKEQVKNYSLLKEGDLIMADASEDYSGIGKSVEVRNLGSHNAIAGLHTFLLREKKDM